MKNKFLLLTISLYITFLMLYINNVIGLLVYCLVGIGYLIFLFREKMYKNILIYIFLFLIVFIIPTTEEEVPASDLEIKTDYMTMISNFYQKKDDEKAKIFKSNGYSLNSEEIEGEYWEKSNSYIVSNEDSIQIYIMLSDSEQFSLSQSEEESSVLYYNNDTDANLLFIDGECQGECDLYENSEDLIVEKINKTNNNIISKLKG